MRLFSSFFSSSEDIRGTSLSAHHRAFNRKHRDVLRLVGRHVVQDLEADEFSVLVLDENDLFGCLFRDVLFLRVVEPDVERVADPVEQNLDRFHATTSPALILSVRYVVTTNPSPFKC